MTTLDRIREIPGWDGFPVGFKITEKGDRYIVCCEKCSVTFDYPKEGEWTPANSRTLLNHRSAHEEK